MSISVMTSLPLSAISTKKSTIVKIRDINTTNRTAQQQVTINLWKKILISLEPWKRHMKKEKINLSIYHTTAYPTIITKLSNALSVNWQQDSMNNTAALHQHSGLHTKCWRQTWSNKTAALHQRGVCAQSAGGKPGRTMLQTTRATYCRGIECGSPSMLQQRSILAVLLT